MDRGSQAVAEKTCGCERSDPYDCMVNALRISISNAVEKGGCNCDCHVEALERMTDDYDTEC